MAARPIDGNTLIEWFRPYLHTGEAIPADVVIEDILSMPTLTQPNEWVSVEERLPEPGERVLAAKGTFVGEAYLASNGAWMRHDGFPWEVDAWMPLPAPPGKDNNVPAKAPNEPLTQADLDAMDYDKVWLDYGGDGEWALVVSGRIYALAVLEGAGFEDILRDEVDGETMDRPSGNYTVYLCPPEGEEDA